MHFTGGLLLSDIVFNEELSTSLMRIEANHIQQENNVKLEAQAKILLLNEEVIRRQTLLTIATGLIALLLVGFVVLLIRTNRQKQRLNAILDNKVHQRTEELKLSRDGLQRAFEERDLLIRKVTEEMRSSLATIKGLCHLGSRDVFEAQQYLNKVNIVSEALANMIVKLDEKKWIDDVGKIRAIKT